MKKHSIAACAAGIAVTALLYLCGCDNIVTPPDTYAPSSKTVTIGVAGGSVSLADNGGFTITLTLPYGALAGDTAITLRSVGTAFGGPFSHVLYPGLEIEPRDLLLEYPARLEIQCPVGTDMSSRSLLYCCWTDTLMAPLEDLEVNPVGPQIWGTLYLLGRYAIATPTTAEMQAQLNAWGGSSTGAASRFSALSNSAGACPPDGYGWQGFKTRTSGMVGWAAAFKSLDSAAGDQGAADAQQIIENIVTNDIMEFSTLAPPFNPCGSYIRAALRYYNSAALLGVKNAVVDELYEDIGNLIDQCKVQFTYRYDSESSFESDAPNMSQSRQTSGYVVVNCSVSYWDLSEGADSCEITGVGAGEFSEKARTDYKNVENDVVTVDISEEMTYTCTGRASWDAQEEVFKANFTIVGEGTKHTETCDSRNDTPCWTLDDDISSRKTFSGIPLVSGYTISEINYVDDPALGTVSVVEQITNANAFQPENPDPDGPCY
jgi:hypothetical protein